VYTSFLGKTVEVNNTDAEGRLTLADALAYAAKKLKPSRIIDLATLTGSCVVALGHEVAALLSNSDVLAQELMQSSTRTHERIWELPLYDDYRERLKSDIADIKNTAGRDGGAILGGAFLRDFVEDIPWAHLDIAGTAFLNESKGYLPKYGTGFGVRLLVDFLEHLCNKER
jgi:leucyl aminopeptidase